MSKTCTDESLPGLLRECRISGATMGTRFSARFLSPRHVDVDALGAALMRAVTAVDRQMSNWLPDSDLSRVNRTAPGTWIPVPTALAKVLKRAVEVGRETGGAFDIGVGELVDAWGFGPSRRRQPQPPSSAPRPPVEAWLEVDARAGRVRKRGFHTIDLCGIAKGFGVDALGNVLDDHGIGAWLVGIDGEMRARGRKPDGSTWTVALEAPLDDRREALGVVELTDAAIATSGDYRRVAWVDGQRVAHTMDPRTGAPLRGALASVTVMAPSCMDADAYATAWMVMGEAEGLEQARRLGLDACFIVRTGEGFRLSGTGCFIAAS